MLERKKDDLEMQLNEVCFFNYLNTKRQICRSLKLGIVYKRELKKIKSN